MIEAHRKAKLYNCAFVAYHLVRVIGKQLLQSSIATGFFYPNTLYARLYGNLSYHNDYMGNANFIAKPSG